MYFHSAYDLEEQALQNQRTAREMARLILVQVQWYVRAEKLDFHVEHRDLLQKQGR